MKRILLTLLAAMTACSPLLVCDSGARAATPQSAVQFRRGKVDPRALRELLVKGLKATRKNERAYIDHIVSLVVQNKLPLSLVYASFDYARKRRPSYPFPYFVFSVETLAKRKNIDI
jgi:hypothetical protein